MTNSLLHRGSALSKQQATADTLASAAVAEIVSGMTVGLGAGLAAARGIHALAQRVADEGLDINCVGASERSEDLGRSLGLKIIDFALLEEIDVLIDGADEVDRSMVVLKGSRGAMTRERILCWASKRTIFMVTEKKVAQTQVGANCPLPIAVMAYGVASTRKALRHIGINGVIRQDMHGRLFLTDNGNLVLDATIEGHVDIHDLAMGLNDIPGVIDHGLFIDEADTILIEKDDGSIERLDRPIHNS